MRRIRSQLLVVILAALAWHLFLPVAAAEDKPPKPVIPSASTSTSQASDKRGPGSDQAQAPPWSAGSTFRPPARQASSPRTAQGCEDLVQNGSYESGDVWTAPHWWYSNAYRYVLRVLGLPFRTGQYSSWLGDGLVGSLHLQNEILLTPVRIPDRVASATFSYWWWVYSREGTSYPYDTLYVRVWSLAGDVLRSWGPVSNQSARNGWYRWENDLRDFAGQWIYVGFNTDTDSSLPTAFFVDDVSLVACAQDRWKASFEGVEAPGPLLPGQRGRVRFWLRNDGTDVWQRSGSNPVRLATMGGSAQGSGFYTPGSWLSPNRPATLDRDTVAPGETTLFEFQVTGYSQPGTYREEYELVAEGDSIFPRLGLYLNYTVLDLPRFKASFQGAEAPGPLLPGQRGRVRFWLRNDGTDVWQRSGSNPVRLATMGGSAQGSGFYTPGSWLSPNRPATLDRDTVAPGETTLFEFQVTGYSQPGTYREEYELVAEGFTVFPRVGLFLNYTVVGTGVTTQRHFGVPSNGNNTYNGFSSTHPGVDIQDGSSRPLATSLLCLAEVGSVSGSGMPISRGDYQPDNTCDDWKGAPVRAGAAGLVTAAGVEDYGSEGKPHVVRILHGTLPDGRKVVTKYLHMGTKVRDGRNIVAGSPIASFITVTVGPAGQPTCVAEGTPIGSQGYSGWTVATHLHYEVVVGGDERGFGGVKVDPSEWFNRSVDLVPPRECP